jgi:hypothetical protein
MRMLFDFEFFSVSSRAFLTLTISCPVFLESIFYLRLLTYHLPFV